MRATVRSLLVGTPALTTIVPAGRWYQAGNVIDNPPKPFVVLRWLAPVPGQFRLHMLRQLRIDVHDERGSYRNIDMLIGSPDKGDGIFGVLSSIANLVGVDGRVMQADWLGHSGDQEDPDYSTNLKFTSWQLIGVDL